MFESVRWAQYDSLAAALSICLQAVAEGLVSHQMGGVDLQLLRERERAPRKRKPIDQTVFYANGEKPWKI